MRAWMRNKMTNSKGCHLNNICQANRLQFLAEESSNIVEVARIFSSVATRGLVREISPPDTDVEEEYYEAGRHGTLLVNISRFPPQHYFLTTGRQGEDCEVSFKCPHAQRIIENLAEKITYFPTVISNYIN